MVDREKIRWGMRKVHKFSILKRINCSTSNVIANYLDLEHLAPSHNGLADVEVIAETETVACFSLSSKVGFLVFRNIHYYEFRPPNVIFQVVNTPLGIMRVEAKVVEVYAENGKSESEVAVTVQLEVPSIFFPFRKLIETYLKHLNQAVLQEDNYILERRHKLFGDYVGDYLLDEQPLLFKRQFAAHYGHVV